LKMLKGSSPASSLETTGTTQQERPFCSMSFGSWSVWVTRQRGEYSARLNAARLTSESGSSSWPTCATRGHKGCGNAVPRKDGKHRLDTLEAVVMFGPHDPASPSTHGSRPESWATPRPPNGGQTTSGAEDKKTKRQVMLQHQVESWATPRAGCPGSRAPGTGGKVLEEQVKEPKAWATPRAEHDSGGHRGTKDTLHSQIKTQATGKLNPRWVETLMGLPVGWTMPSCQSPVTTAPTSCASLAME
jgi:hypothetical protein